MQSLKLINHKYCIRVGLICHSIFIIHTLYSCGPRPSLEDFPKNKGKLAQPFTIFKLTDFKAIVVKCDLGWLSLNIIQYQYPKIEIHKTYQKYVHLEPRNDTLFIYTENTPRETETLAIHKSINIYVPNLKYIKSNSSKVVLKDIYSHDLRIHNIDNSMRLYNCTIRDLNIYSKGISIVQIDKNNYFETLKVKMNEKSHFNTSAKVLKSLTLEKKTLENTNFRNLPENGFHWLRN